MPKLLALPALLLTAYVSVALVGCGGSTEPIAAGADGGGAGLNTGGSSSSNPQQIAGASAIGDNDVGGSASSTGQPDAGGPSTEEATVPSSAGAPSNPDSTSSAFKCGDLSCDSATEYCFGLVGGINPDQFQCKKLPTGCQATPTCACIAPSVPPAAACPCTETDGLRVSCMVG